ncbi:MAG: alpha-mannosidase [Phycisphaerales bacterium]|jgi:alpha-mannosidase|nr:alpha-mannosidase [Phycisphaerales bacterium]
MQSFTFHLIGNAHLDPVWLWNWQEGLTEGLVTCRTVLDMMDEFPQMTFIRGESAIYRFIEENDPRTFARIKKQVKAGRWDVVGGTVIQPDTNLPDTETFARQLNHGQRYFESRFGRRSKVAWTADSFGHSAGLPEIYAAAGIESLAFTRPHQAIVPIPSPAFWWEGPGGSRILAYRPAVGWYGSDRTEINDRLDQLLADAQQGNLHNVGAFYGLGNHGGGPSRLQLRDIDAWAKAHPQVKVVHSGLHRLFASIRQEIAKENASFLPVHHGELNFVLRGCYASVAKFKFAYRRGENLLRRAERTAAAVNLSSLAPHFDLENAWDGVLFNSFHDILPGSSIERAYDEQIAWMGQVQHQSQSVELKALTALGAQLDTRVPKPVGDMPSTVPVVVWNPHPRPYEGYVELENGIDYRPAWQYLNRPNELPMQVRGTTGKALPLQVIAQESYSTTEVPWRKRVVVPVSIPAMGWNVLDMGWVEGATIPQISNPTKGTEGEISNGLYGVQAKAGDAGVRILRGGNSLFGKELLRAITVEDPWGSWGGMREEKESVDLSQVRHEWKVTRTQILESGPLRSALWVRMEGGNSWLELTFMVYAGRDAVDVSARVLWNDRSARLKLVMPAGDQARFKMAGTVVERGPLGEVPGGRWIETAGVDGESFGFASDGLYGFDCKDGALRATVVRASRYANDVPAGPDQTPWRPAVDCGELRFKFLFTGGGQRLVDLARELEEPLVVQNAPAHPGKWRKSGSILSLEPAELETLAFKRADDGKGFILRVQETGGRAVNPKLVIGGKRVKLSKVGAWKIATWRLIRRGSNWIAEAVDIVEKKLPAAKPSQRRKTTATANRR